MLIILVDNRLLCQVYHSEELKDDLPQPAPGDDTGMLKFVDGMMAELQDM
jgi:hypothetical protein